MTVRGAAADMTKKTTDGTPSLSFDSDPWIGAGDDMSAPGIE
jgi:hypothetical protein